MYIFYFMYKADKNQTLSFWETDWVANWYPSKHASNSTINNLRPTWLCVEAHVEVQTALLTLTFPIPASPPLIHGKTEHMSRRDWEKPLRRHLGDHHLLDMDLWKEHDTLLTYLCFITSCLLYDITAWPGTRMITDTANYCSADRWRFVRGHDDSFPMCNTTGMCLLWGIGLVCVCVCLCFVCVNPFRQGASLMTRR